MKNRRLYLVAAIILVVAMMTACGSKSAMYDAPAAEAPMAAADSADKYSYATNDSMAMTEEAEADIAYDSGSTDNSTDYTGVTGEQAGTGVSLSQRKLIQDIYLTAEVDDPSVALRDAVTYVESIGGYMLGSDDWYDSEYNTGSSSVTLRIPSGQSDSVRAFIEETLKGKIESDSTSSQDVTNEYYDLQIRIEQGEAELEKLNEILEQCTTVDEVLSVRSQISWLQSDVESMKGQFKRLSELTSYDTIYLSFSPHPNLVSKDDDTGRIMSGSEFGAAIKKAFSKSVRALVNGAGYLAIFLVTIILPLAAILVIVWLVLKATKKRRVARREKKAAEREARKNRPMQASPYMTGAPSEADKK